MKRLINLILIIVFVYTGMFAANETAGVKEEKYYPIDSESITYNTTSRDNRDFYYEGLLIGESSYDHYPFSYNNWGMSYDENSSQTYIIFTDCDELDHQWEPGIFDRNISFNVIDSNGEPMFSPEGEAEPTYAGYPDLLTSVNGRLYVAFHKNDQGYYPWIKGDQYNLGGSQVIWHEKQRCNEAHSDWIWPQIRMTSPLDDSEGLIYMMGTDSNDPNSRAEVYRVTPQIDLNGWLAAPFYSFNNVNTVINEEESILHPSMAVSEDGSIVGVFYTTGEASTAAAKYVYSTDEGVSWSEPVNLSFDKGECDVDNDGIIDGNWSISGTGVHLFFDTYNEPCVAYIKNVTAAGGTYYPFTSKVFFGKIDIDNAELIEHRVSDVIDPEVDITGGCCGPNAKSIAARVAIGQGGEYMAILWVDSRDMLAQVCSNAEIYMSYSFDWGATWSEDVNLTNTNTGTNDLDEVWLTVAPQLDVVIHEDEMWPIPKMVFMIDESPGNSVSDTNNPGEITMNEIFYSQFNPANDIMEDYKIASKPDFTLMQNKPNPFNPTTTITFDIAEADGVKVSVYNIKGELVNVIADGFYNTGSHTLVWNGKDNNANSVSSGIYFYTMETSGFSQTRKMILLK